MKLSTIQSCIIRGDQIQSEGFYLLVFVFFTEDYTTWQSNDIAKGKVVGKSTLHNIEERVCM